MAFVSELFMIIKRSKQGALGIYWRDINEQEGVLSTSNVV